MIVNWSTLLLSVGILLGALALLVYGRRRRAALLQEPTEDVLKHLFDCEYRGRLATLQSTAGALGKPQDKVATLLDELQTQGLVSADGDGWVLTAAGRQRALRVVRAHRLWERYLADRTGHRAAEWHLRSERQEHRLTPEETDSLAAELMHPRFDPHGDPIPTAAGVLPPPIPYPSLLQTPPQTAVRVVHLEDEPPQLYRTLVDEGMHVGMQLDEVAIGADLIRVQAEGRTFSLSPAAAANVTVMALRPEETVDLAGVKPLNELKLGETGRVVQISARCQGSERRRLLDLGILPGTSIRAELKSPSGDPTAYRVRGALIGLRHEQADYIQIVPTAVDATAGSAYEMTPQDAQAATYEVAR